MKAVVYIAVGATLLAAGTADAQQRRVRHNAASGHARHLHVERGPVVERRVQTYYSDTGWQGGYGPVDAYGYGPPVVVAPSPEPIRHGGYGAATRSMPFGYPVDGYGRYPWVRGQYQQGYYQPSYHQGGYDQGCGRCGPPQPVYVSQPPVYVSPPPVYVEGPRVYVAPADVRVAPAQVEVAPPQVHFEQGYYAMPDAPPPPPPQRSPTERPYTPYVQEPGERG